MGRIVGSVTLGRADARVKAAAHRGMRKASAIVADYMRYEVSTKLVPYGPSRPGDPPNRKTDELYGSIFWEYDQFSFRSVIGTTSDHGVYTEFGLSYDARPWARPAFVDNISTVAWAIARAF